MKSTVVLICVSLVNLSVIVTVHSGPGMVKTQWTRQVNNTGPVSEGDNTQWNRHGNNTEGQLGRQHSGKARETTHSGPGRVTTQWVSQ